ncbi:MAG: alpha/beta hydrolase [Clostridia bacterium]|jgi:alpha-beta hydrolase superfamily lysophospholipase|nr:alpha/beta hydrolase [Clostridia bacterium]
MKKIEKKLKSKCDGLELGITITTPEEKQAVKGIVQICHGMAEHRKRYLPFIEFLSSQGYICVIHDHRGHGESIKEKEDLGYFYEKNAVYIIEDLHQVTQYIKEQYPDLPVYLFGHSMGSLIVRCYLKRYDDEIDKLIVCGSPSNNPLAGIGIAVSKTIQLFKGDKYRSKLMQKLTFSSYAHKFKEEKKEENCWISESKENKESYEKDENCGFIFTLNGFQNLYKLVQKTYSEKGWEKKNLELPIFFIAGDQDPVLGNLGKWVAAYEFLQNRIGYSNISHKLYKDKRHELLNEDIKEKVYQDILNWIEK